MYAIAIAVMSVFAVWGVMCILRDVCERLLSGGKCDRVIIYVKSDAERVEGVVRSLMLKNPTAEIVVADEGCADELRSIVDKLCRDYACVHIGKLD
ncbi:MAG: hypothetical protein IJ366_00875 [Clostridia bacterium]|nr:hypothetical protein [Clostridia bacterium]